MNRTEIKSLKQRWKKELSSENFSSLTDEVTEARLKDFRGINSSWGVFDINATACDFSYAHIKLGFTKSILSNSLFDSTSIEDQLGNVVENCKFKKSKFTSVSFLGEVQTNVFESCKFIKGRSSSSTTFDNVQFVDCQFKKCSFHNTKFSNCKFINCSFDDTSLADSKFTDSGFENCTILNYFGLSNVEFQNCGVNKDSFSGSANLVDDNTVYG